MKQVEIFTDGACSGNPGPGGWGAILEYMGHEKELEIIDGELRFKEITRPYGFVDLGAKVWFQKFLDDGEVEREYLMTEGYLWTSQYPECERIIKHGNNQSMELNEETLDATWTKDRNGKPKFFIINEAIIAKLCRFLGKAGKKETSVFTDRNKMEAYKCIRL